MADGIGIRRSFLDGKQGEMGGAHYAWSFMLKGCILPGVREMSIAIGTLFGPALAS
ncbi:MAG: hypothetical protein WCC11_06300 [Gammaproteobacteria bacterium]